MFMNIGVVLLCFQISPPPHLKGKFTQTFSLSLIARVSIFMHVVLFLFAQVFRYVILTPPCKGMLAPGPSAVVSG